MMRKIRWSKSAVCIALGALLILGACGLSAYNIWDNYRAQQDVVRALDNLEVAEEALPFYEHYPEMEMPSVEVNGYWYIGMIEIPALDRTLPVMSAWSYPNLKVAPCRYGGSAYTDDLIILAHNYRSHFGAIKSLYAGDAVDFTDMNGNVFHYRVAEIEILDDTAVEEMNAGEWDLTLFTCTPGGQARVTVRCELVE